MIKTMAQRWQFLVLLFFFLFLRVFPILWDNFPYAYDNAKDSLVLMQFGVFGKPPLLGAVTSLEGLWQGPFWYYVLFPLNFILGYHPFSSVLTIVLLGVFTLWLLWKYLGKFEATVFTVSSLVITTHQTAWSPYLAMFSSAWVLVILHRIKKTPKTFHLVLLGFSLATMFNAEIAFAVPFVLLVVIVLLIQRVKPTLKQIFLGVCTFLVLFVPQALFELRHDFLQTRSVVRFISNFKSESEKVNENKEGLERVGEVLSTFSDNVFRSISPIDFDSSGLVKILITIGLFLIFLKFLDRKRITILIPVILGSFIFYLFLPLKPFYLVGLTPFWIYGFSGIFKKRIILKRVAIGGFVLMSIYAALYSKINYEKLARDTTILFSSQRNAIEAAYKLASNGPFVSYHYLPEVYDYTYQHIYQYTSKLENRDLPIEYSYFPGEKGYMQTIKLSSSSSEPKYRVLVVEKDDRPHFFETWWNNLTRDKEIIVKEKVNEAVDVYLLKEK